MHERVTLVVDAELKRSVQRAARERGLSMSEYIRRAVQGQLIRDEFARGGSCAPRKDPADGSVAA